MDLTPLLKFIEANSDLVIGTDLFEFSLPEKVTRAVLLLQDSVGQVVDHEIPGRHMERFQVITRENDFERGKSISWQMYHLLTVSERKMMDDICVQFIRPRNTPFPYPRSDGDLIEFSVNFDVKYDRQ